MLSAIKSAYGKYATFSGRATRGEFWWFLLFFVLTYVAALFVILAVESLRAVAFVALAVFYLASLVPYLSVMVRRLHDTNRSGWWFWISLIPFGSIVLLVLLALPGTVGPNKYGPDPRQMPALAAA